MSPSTLQTASILLVVLPTVAFGGVSILYLWLSRRHPYYRKNPLHQRLWAAGHAHAGVLLVLSLVSFQYIDAAALSSTWKEFVRWAIPGAAILIPATFFLSGLPPEIEKPTPVNNLAYLGIGILAGS